MKIELNGKWQRKRDEHKPMDLKSKVRIICTDLMGQFPVAAEIVHPGNGGGVVERFTETLETCDRNPMNALIPLDEYPSEIWGVFGHAPDGDDIQPLFTSQATAVTAYRFWAGCAANVKLFRFTRAEEVML